MTQHLSSTLTVPEVSAVPRHVAIIMDGNGRWASKRLMPRVAGHSEGLGAVRKIVEENTSFQLLSDQNSNTGIKVTYT